MSKGPLNFKGAPKSQLEYTPIRLFQICGGAGGGECLEPAGVEYVIWAYRVPKFITYNRKVVFNNPEFLGVQMFNDAGPAGFCDHSVGTEQVFYVGLSASSADDPEATAKAGVELSGDLPYEIEFYADKIPQPTDPDWENIIYVYVWWGSTAFINGGNVGGQISNDRPLFQLVKHDYDIKI